MRLKDKVAIVTGGAHGMGEAEARLFASEGAKVVVADILGNEAEAVAAHIRAGGGEAIAATIDVTSEPAWVELIAKTLASYGRLDVVVNNAGISGSSGRRWRPIGFVPRRAAPGSPRCASSKAGNRHLAPGRDPEPENSLLRGDRGFENPPPSSGKSMPRASATWPTSIVRWPRRE